MSLPLHKFADIRVAAECCIIAEGKILLQKRPENSTNFPNFWTLPGGHIDEMEDAHTAVIREIFEETGITLEPQKTKLKVSAINHHIDKFQVWVIFGFVSFLEKELPAISSSEGICQWFTLEEVKSMNEIFPPIAVYLEHITNKKSGMLYMSAELENAQLVKKHTWIEVP